jgi:hypothetical protein
LSEDFAFLGETVGLSFRFPFFVVVLGTLNKAVIPRSKFSSAFGPSVYSGDFMFISYAKRLRDWLHDLAENSKKAREAAHEDNNSAIEGRTTAPVLRAELKIPDSAIDKIKAKTAEETSRENWKAFRETLTLAIVLAYTMVATFQWCELNTQNINQSTANTTAGITADRAFRQSERTIRLDQMAWIKVILPDFHPDRTKEGQTLMTPITFLSTGKTAALDVEAKVRMEIVKNGQVPSLRYPHYGEMYGGLLTPGDGVDNTAAVLDEVITSDHRKTGTPHYLDKSEAEALRQQSSRPAIFGIVTYRDIFGVDHVFKFCRIMMPRDTMVSTAEVDAGLPCMRYNSIDGNRPK